MPTNDKQANSWDSSDSRRDAERYRRLLLALRRATSEIRALEENRHLDLEEVLARLLPDLAEALNAAQAFVALRRTGETGGQQWFELTAVHPDSGCQGRRLEESVWLQRLIEDGKPKVIDSLDESAPQLIPGLELFEATSALLGRVQIADQLCVVGLCNKVNPAYGPFLAADGLALDNILELVAIGAEVGERRRRELAGIQKTSAVISAELNLESLLPAIVKEAAAVFEAPATSLMLWDDSGQNLVIKAKYGLSDEYAQQQRIPAERVQAAKQSMDLPHSLLIPDLYLAPYGEIKLIKRERLRTVLIAPLWAEGQLTGVLNIYSRDEPRLFTVYEQELAQVFANQAAIAVQNAQFYVGARSRAQQLQDVLAAGQNITALRPIRDVLQAITDSLVANFGYDAVTLFPYQAEATTFEPPVISGQLYYPKIVLRKVAGDNLVEKRLTGPEFYFTPDTPDDPLLSGKFSGREGIKSSGYVRLTVGGEVVGILFVNYRQAHYFSEDEQRAVRLFANQAAMAIHNTRQFAALQSQLGQLEMALAAGQGMMMRRPLRETLQGILEQLVRGEGYDIARLILYRPVRGAFGYTLVAGQLRNYAKTVGQLHEGSVVERRLVEGPDEYFTSDAPADPLVAGSFVEREGIRAIGSLRLKDNGQTVGLLLVNKRHPHQFTIRERDTLRLYAGQIEVAFHEARLFYREQERIEMLGRIGQQVGQTLDLATVLETLYSELRIVFGADITPDVLLYDESKQELYVPFPERLGLSVDVAEIAGHTTFKLDEGICGWVAQHKQPLNVPDVLADPRYLRLLQTTRSELTVPILLGERLVGVLDIKSPTLAKFSEDEQRLLEAVANQVAVAIRNAEQYAVLMENQQQLEALSEAGRAIVKAGLELETVLQTILDQAVMVTQANFGTIHLLRGDTLEFVAAWPPERLEWLKREIGQMRLDGPGITPRAVRENQAQLVADVSQDPDFVDATSQTKSELAVVLRRGGQREGGPVGVLNVEHREVNGFTREDRDLLIAFSNLAMVAINNAEQYKALQEARDHGLATEAVAWLGLFGADWQHTINQKAFSIGNYVETLRRWLARHETPPDVSKVVLETLEGIEKVTTSIRTVQFIDRVPAETPGEGEGEALIDPELQKTVTRWCNGREDIVQIFKLQCPGVKVKIPPQWLRVAMEKLVNNALKAMPQGGQLTVSTERLGGLVHISVEDTGQGIPDFALPHFLKVTIRRPDGDREGGTGKGALIARFVVRSYGGDLKLVHTGKDAGTKLLLTLPVLVDN